MDDVYKQIPALRKRMENLVKPEVPLASTEALAKIFSLFQMIPGRVGFWPMSSVQRSTGNAYDLSGQGRTLTYNGNPTYNLHNSLVPYLDLDGTGDFLSRADETDLDILGTETIYPAARRGLTMGGWFWSDNIATQYALMSKFLAAGDQRSYLLQFVSSQANFGVSSLGTAASVVTVASGTNLSSGTWYFIVCRFTPSTELAIWVNGVKAANTTSIPASIFNSTAAFAIGGLSGGTLLLDGRATLCFLSANALPDAWVSTAFEQSRILFGV